VDRVKAGWTEWRNRKDETSEGEESNFPVNQGKSVRYHQRAWNAGAETGIPRGGGKERTNGKYDSEERGNRRGAGLQRRKFRIDGDSWGVRVG